MAPILPRRTLVPPPNRGPASLLVRNPARFRMNRQGRRVFTIDHVGGKPLGGHLLEYDAGPVTIKGTAERR